MFFKNKRLKKAPHFQLPLNSQAIFEGWGSQGALSGNPPFCQFSLCKFLVSQSLFHCFLECCSSKISPGIKQEFLSPGMSSGCGSGASPSLSSGSLSPLIQYPGPGPQLDHELFPRRAFLILFIPPSSPQEQTVGSPISPQPI